MLTVRLQLNGVLSAFQTNRMVSLLLPGDAEFDAVMVSLPDSEVPGVFDICANQYSPVMPRESVQGRPLAMVKIDHGRNEPGDTSGDSSYGDGNRFISLYENDSAIVLDSGAKLFEWAFRS